MEKPTSVKCANCIFNDNGICKRYPPVYVPKFSNISTTHNGGTSNATETHQGYSEFPFTPNDEWCGEFMPKDNLTAVEWVTWIKDLKQDAISE